MKTSMHGREVDRSLYQIARDEALRKIAIPSYFKDIIDPTVDLSKNPKALCPFHEEKTPSFRYKGEENYWKCFGKCQTGGTVIELHAHQYKIVNHFEALWDLKVKFGKRYGLEFKNFFTDEATGAIPIDQILATKKTAGLSLNEFISADIHSAATIANSIDQKLQMLKSSNIDLYAEFCIEIDNLTVYGNRDDDKLKEILQKLEAVT